MKKKCIACGVSMAKPQDYPQNDTTKDYCVHCSNPDGSMHSYKQQIASLTKMFMETQGLDKAKAREAAIIRMSNLPAWKDKFCK